MTPPGAALLAHAEAALAELLAFARPADQALSAYFRRHRNLGQQDRAFIAETAFAVLRRRRSLEAAAGSAVVRDLAVAALVRVFGLSGRALAQDAALVARVKAFASATLPAAVQADLPDWLWERLLAAYGAQEAAAIAQGLLGAAPLDLRVNLAKLSREEALARLGLDGAPTALSPAGIRLKGKPPINRHALFLAGAVEVQDEGSQLLAYLLAPRRGEMVADFCAGAGGKTLALAMLMHGTGRIYAMDVSAKRLRELAPRAARAGISNVHPIALAGEADARGQAARRQARPRAGGRALQRLRHAAAQSGPEVAPRSRRRGASSPPSRRASWMPPRGSSSPAGGSSTPPAASCPTKTRPSPTPSRRRIRSSRPCPARSCWRRNASRWTRASACGSGRTGTAPTASSPPPTSGSRRRPFPSRRRRVAGPDAPHACACGC